MPITPVCTDPAAAAAVLLEGPGASVPVGVTVVEAETPDVKGTSEAEETPVNAGVVVVAPGAGGEAEVLLGLRTLF